MRSLWVSAVLAALAPLIVATAEAECVDYAETVRWVATLETPGYAEVVAVSGPYAYVLDSIYPYNDGDLRVIDVSDPSSPSLAASLHLPSYPSDLAVAGESVYIADGAGGLHVADVSDFARAQMGAATSVCQVAVLR